MYTLHHGDCLEVMRSLPENSVDAVVTDPPAGISFMNRSWDSDKGGRTQWVSWMTDVMAECLRVLKPGGHALVWALPRTSHWTATAIEDAGFEVRDVITHHFGSGFPKSANISKYLDKMAGAEGEVVKQFDATYGINKTRVAQGYRPNEVAPSVHRAPATDLAKQYDGWGTALKPASEHWILARKPLIGTVAANITQWGVGGLNIDATRIPTGDSLNGGAYAENGVHRDDGWRMQRGGAGDYQQPQGRWPANVILSHAPDCRLLGAAAAPSDGHYPKERGKGGIGTTGHAGHDNLEERRTAGEIIERWECVEDCPARLLDEQSGTRVSGANPSRRGSSTFRNVYGEFQGQEDCIPARGANSGGASRFYYCGKASTKERTLPNGTRNPHPTVKPLALMRYLVRLVTPPGGTVLDPFAGSGTTLVAALEEGFNAIGIERDAAYIAICRERLAVYTLPAAS